MTGYCFQFNSDGGMKAKSPGKSGGMQFILDVQAKEYTTGPYSLSEGFAVSLCVEFIKKMYENGDY